MTTTAHFSRSRLALMIGLLVGLLAVAPACEIDDDEGTADMTQRDTTNNTQTHQVSLTASNTFSPNEITIDVGDTVRWTNNYDADLRLDFGDSDPIADSGDIQPGGTHSITFSQAGSFGYVDFYNGASGVVIVQ